MKTKPGQEHMTPKTIKTPLIITSFRAKVDGSLGLSAVTPELTNEEKVEFMNLQNLNVTGFFEPIDQQTKDVKEIKGEFDSKKPSQRLRNVIYVYFEQKGAKGDFDTFYLRQMNKLIDKVKENLQ